MAAQTMQEAGFYGGVKFGPNFVLREPAIASAAMNVIATFAEIEAAMGELLAVMLSGNSSPTIALYNSLRNSGAQRDAIRAVAEDIFDEESQRVFLAILKLFQSCVEERNKLAHWVWGSADEIPNALILMSPKQRLLLRQKFENFIGDLIEGRGDGTGQHQPDYGEIFIYRESDFENVSLQLARVASFVAKFGLIASPDQPTLKTEAIEQLSREPEIAAILRNSKRKLNKGLA